MNYKNSSSDTLNVNIGIPQGSILGPLLFILYINDLHNVSDKLTLLQFADDSSFFVSGRSLPELFNVLQNEIVKIREWLNNNKLSLNISKTNYMIMTNRKKVQQNDDFQLSIDGQTISQVNETKFLGVIIDDRMTFKSHINHIAGKMSKGVGIICKARKLLPQYSLKTIYRAIVEPYMTYCIEVWGHTYGTYTNKLFMLQKKLMRLITYSEYDAHTTPLFKSMQLLTFKQLYEYFVAVLVYKSVNNQLPYPFIDYFSFAMSARNGNCLKTKYHSLKMCQFSNNYMGPKIWNKLPCNLRQLNSLSAFKRNMKKYLKNML